MSMISVIVPVYNCEGTLSKCIDSVMAQVYTDWELILVNDGSTDGSQAIINEFATKSDRIIVVHQENQGVVAAREAGLARAKGDWIAFIDSDDWIEPDMFYLAMEEAKSHQSVDIVWFDVNVHGRESIRNIHYDPTVDLVRSLLTTNQHGWLWNKIYRREFWDSVGVKVDSSCGIMEDSYMLLQLYVNSPTICYVSKATYNYKACNVMSATAIDCVYGCGYKNILNMHAYLIQHNMYHSYQKEMDSLIMRAEIDILKSGKKLKKMDRKYWSLSMIPIYTPLRIIYWIGLNGGMIGQYFFKVFFRLIK